MTTFDNAEADALAKAAKKERQREVFANLLLLPVMIPVGLLFLVFCLISEAGCEFHERFLEKR